MGTAQGRPSLWADDVFVALAPARTYATLVTCAHGIAWWRALRRPALVLLVIGTALSGAATGLVTVTLVASTMLSSSFVVIVQLAAAVLLVATRRERPVTMPAAVDLLFAGHVPWSLWMVAVGVWAASGMFFSLDLALLTMVMPIGWTAVILAAFCREVLQTSAQGARLRTIAHQAIVWSCAVTFVAWASGGWFRLLGR